MPGHRDLIGKVFGDLKVLEYLGQSNWRCICKCGNEVVAKTGKLTSGRKTRCSECIKKNDKRAINLIGKTFGKWKVLRYAGDRHWECECTGCHRVFIVRGNSLRDGHSMMCIECANKAQSVAKEDLTGRVFGELTVLGYEYKSMWRCKCSCGKIVNIRGDKLKSGYSVDCGDWTIHKEGYNLLNKQIGEWKVLRYLGNSYWECQCSCGNIRNVHGYTLRTGMSTNCGAPVHRIKYHLEGKRFGALVVEKHLGNMVNLCKCDCGNKIKVLTVNLVNGSTRSCGCKTKEYKNACMIDRYGDISWVKAQRGPREKWQMEVIHDKEAFNALMIQLRSECDEITPNDLSEILNIHPAYVVQIAKSFGCNNLIKVKTGRSKLEDELCEYIKTLTTHEVIQSDRSVLNGRELDIYIPDLKLAIEFNGVYWHSEMHKDERYHQQKTLDCLKQGVRLIHIFEYEWINPDKQTKIMRYLADVIGEHSEIYYARNLNIREPSVQESVEFLDKYHLQGYTNAPIRYGLYNDTEMLGIITFGKPRFSSNYEYELIRLCWKPGVNVVGGFERLFKHFVTEHNPSSIVTYSDISKFTGNSYLRVGFKASIGDLTSPNYVWVGLKDYSTLSRYQTQKHKLVELGLGDAGDTEASIMENLGYIRMYDCGNLRLSWYKQ